MLRGLISKVVGDSNEREINKLAPLVEAVNALEPEMERRSDAELRALTDRFRARLAAGENLDDILVEAFALVRETAKRTVDMRPFDVQLIGGIVLHQGKVAEMKTGEGKTLVATMPLYLNALLGQGVHLVTVNDYLARRDSQWMGAVYHMLGLSVGLLQSGADQPAYLYDPSYQREPYPGLRPVPRRQAYAADITYGTNNEFGFDYLRDNLALSLDRRVQRAMNYAIVDEVDNIFIDEARTPLIISGPSDEPVEEYTQFAIIARRLEQGVHYELDDKEQSVFLTDEGLALVEQETGIENIYDEANYRYVHYMQQALKAAVLFQEGRDYIRQRKQILLIDQHTGRLMPNRRLSEGLHQAIEAKEGVPIRPRDVTSATITIQNYFRLYKKLAGMSGTAVTEAEEFFKIYGLDVVAIPTNEPVARVDHADVVYRSEEAKLRAVAREILSAHSRGQPVLVGTTSVEMSERVSRRLTGERLQMAALAPQAAYALQDADLDRETRASLREAMNASLETINSSMWNRMMRELELNPRGLASENLEWIADYLELPHEPAIRRALEHALREGIAHDVLNAKEHTREAAIIARAGEPGAVTIATNMAGRGVDIKLGGELSEEVWHRAHRVLEGRGLDPFGATSAQLDSAIAEVAPQYAKRRDQVLAVGGLHVLGTERHEARRIDNQLRGRAGRQGEPGSSRFFLSLEDDLMRRFGRREMLSKLMEQIGDDFPIEHNMVSRTIERAQTSVEGYHFDIRKHLLEYDDVLNRQRETIYDERLRILKSQDLRAEVWRMLEGQVDEYLEQAEEDPELQRRLFVGLDDVVPLILPAPKGPFQGPLRFGSHLTAFPPFTISFLADQLTGGPVTDVRDTLRQLARQAAAGYGQQIQQAISQTAQTTLESYEERLGRYQALLDEKIEDYLQLLEERGQPLEPRRLYQHLERTYPLRLTMPLGQDLAQIESLDDLRDHWLAEAEAGFHRQTCALLIERAHMRLPSEAAGSLDRLRAARIPRDKLADELARVQELAAKQARGKSREELQGLALPAEPGPAEVLELIHTVKKLSDIDFGRLDRLIGHVLGAHLEDLIGQYLEAVEDEEGRLRRDLERLQASVVEGQRGGRTGPLAEILAQLNDLVHLDIDTVEDVLGQAAAHEYDKWAQRQLAEIAADVKRNPLTSSSWEAIAEHLLATHYTERQAYDRGHRRTSVWLPRLPFSFVAQAHLDGVSLERLRPQVLDSLRWTLDQREKAWGQQELQRWAQMTLDDLGREGRRALLHYLGGRSLQGLEQTPVAELPSDLQDRIRFILAWQDLEERNPRLADLPHAPALLSHLGDVLEEWVLNTPVGQLEPDLQEEIIDHLRSSGTLDDSDAQARFAGQFLGDLDPSAEEEVARFLGQHFVAAHKEQRIADLPPGALQRAIAYLQGQRRFVDEGQVQQFLVHQSLTDLDPETQQAALSHLARSRLEHLSRRKISNLDVSTRQVVVDSMQRLGLFTDQAQRDQLRGHTVSELRPKAKDGFATFLARQELSGRAVGALDRELQRSLIEQLKQRGLLADPERAAELESHRLTDLDGGISAQVEGAVMARQRQDLATKTMEELPDETRHQVHQALTERDYFIDPEKVEWYERKTLAQLGSELMRGLEEQLGQIRLAEVIDVPFRDLPGDVQGSLLELLDREELLADRAERLRLTQAGTLAELPDQVCERVASHLGRLWLVSLRDRRPPSLPQRDRDLVWAYLRDQGHFVDEFKHELFAFQRLEEFDATTQRAVEAKLAGQLETILATQPVAELPDRLQAEVRERLREADYFVDEHRLRQVQDSPAAELPLELREAIEDALGSYLLSSPSRLSPPGQSLQATPINELPAETREVLWRYLDEIGYFVDEKKQSQALDRRLADLSTGHFEQVVTDLVSSLREEIGEQPVSEIDEELRHDLRQALEELGHFTSEAMREQILAQPLGSVGRDDLDALVLAFGREQLEGLAEKRIRDLPPSEREALLAHLQSRDWFLDRHRLQHIEATPASELDPAIRESLMDSLRQRHAERLRQRRLAGLEGAQKQRVRAFLEGQGLAARDAEMRTLRQQPLEELEPAIYDELLRELGGQETAGWGSLRFQDLPPEGQELLASYFGRRIMARIELRVLLHIISRLWIDYLTDIEDLRRGIGLEAYGQRDPLVEYKRRAFELFEDLGKNIRRTVVRSLFRQAPQTL
jgi:preprotein translocase subunit SecA